MQAALKARIGSLLIGGKGQMLNTRRSIPMDQLFGRPTVMELKMVSEDSEKSFLMGMLLVFCMNTGSRLDHTTICSTSCWWKKLTAC